MSKGGSLKASVMQELLNASYNPKDKVDGFELDKSLSTTTSKVYHSPTQTVVAHRGTSGAADVATDAVYAYGGISALKLTPRYRAAYNVQKKAEEKYGAKNITTIGHSLGGLLAELVGGKTKEVLTFNKATRPGSNVKQSNQTDVSTTGDVVSSLNPLPFQKNKQIVIKSKTSNPLTEHSLDTLDLGEQLIGEGLKLSNVNIMQSYLTPQAEAQRLSQMGMHMIGRGLKPRVKYPGEAYTMDYRPGDRSATAEEIAARNKGMFGEGLRDDLRGAVDVGRKLTGYGILDNEYVRNVIEPGYMLGIGRGYGGGLYASRIRGSGIPGPPSRSPMTNAMF
jgi:hypothetical protein